MFGSSEYLGSRKIESKAKTELKTPGGDVIVEVRLEGKKYPQLIPQKMLEVSVTKEVSDESTLRAVRCDFMISEILKVLSEYDPKLSELPYITATLTGSLDQAYDIAEAIKWNSEEKSVLDIDRVLKEAAIDKEEIGL